MTIRTLGTTAFTDKPVSMKYRGMFDVHSRSEGKVNYLGPAGRWNLQEGWDQRFTAPAKGPGGAYLWTEADARRASWALLGHDLDEVANGQGGDRAK